VKEDVLGWFSQYLISPLEHIALTLIRVFSLLYSGFFLVIVCGFFHHSCPHKDQFLTYDLVDSNVVHMGNNVQCTIAGIGTVEIKTHDVIVWTLSNVYHVPDLIPNLISLETLKPKGSKYSGEVGVLKVVRAPRYS